ncbi:FAD-binding domain [Mycobacterium terramassiliense]|uniref:2-polyprenyl-6-methoxyphenol hydroxylase and related FAD-dependent oxidoreductases n=1 Tax=Mycobacterium terramassiliense TaxID=1841859 RepID=A0A2U3NCC1_9MYCO|nr:FAD-binding domain [Mycobacterium terramassiliense]SPM29181.1 2-polyprenyl-6-methoxyphenol hydroxylase and related FAD-dependent oxidoreductases [Mycobacterium terramassiliense]
MKIAIVGAGIAGPTLGYWLWRYGHEPTLIEKAPRLRTGGYVVDFWGGGYTVAERMGLTSQLHAAGYAVQELRLVDRDSRKVGGFSAELFRRNLDGRFVTIPRSDLAAMIHRSIDDHVETLFGESVSAITQDDAGVRVTFERAQSRPFDLVVGADGIHSPVRGLVFGPESTFEADLGYRVAAFEAEGYRPRDECVYLAYTTPGRMLARFAMRGEKTLFLFVFTADHLSGPDPQDLSEVRTTLKEVFGDAGWECPEILRALDGAPEVYFDRVSQIVMDRWSQGRVALVGDAAAAVSLLAGEGTGLAMVQAYVLAGELSRAGADHPEAFRRYERRLRPIVEARQRSARAFASMFAPKTALGLWTRNTASRLLDIPKVADWVIGREFGDDIALPEYAAQR